MTRKRERESAGALWTCIVLMYQQLCTLCWAWLTERSPENEQKGVCRAYALHVWYRWKCIQYGVCVGVCVLVSALVGRSAMMDDELAQRGRAV